MSSTPARTASSSIPETDFFARVELEVALADGHFHVPLLVSPYACTTYRGS
jgi:5-hydroxyisourate hydrolase